MESSNRTADFKRDNSARPSPFVLEQDISTSNLRGKVDFRIVATESYGAGLEIPIFARCYDSSVGGLNAKLGPGVADNANVGFIIGVIWRLGFEEGYVRAVGRKHR